MSILVVQLVPEGLLFAADRNITTTVDKGGIVMVGQSQRPKVLKWPNKEAIIGYVGLAEINRKPTDQWLYQFLGRHLSFDDFDQLGRALKEDLEAAIPRTGHPQPLTIHMGGFEKRDNFWVPVVLFIRNTRSLTEHGYGDVSYTFDVSEEISQPTYFGGLTGAEIKDRVAALARDWRPFWVHQGWDLATFNVLDEVMRRGMRAVAEQHPLKIHSFPTTLDEWTRHLRMAVLGYGAYFSAFHEPFEQYVGGGVDVVWAQWPGQRDN